MRRLIVFVALLACGGGNAPRPPGVRGAVLADRFPLARLDDTALCDRLLTRTAEEHAITVDREPRTRRKVIVSDLHLGLGTRDPRFAGLEDFYADAEWRAFLARESARGPTDLIINGDFVEFWQIATALGALPRPDAKMQPERVVLGADQAFAVRAIELVIAAHPDVFRALGAFLDGGDHRVIIIPGNHDADLLWPKVQLAIARAIAPRDPSRLVFVDGAAYEHAGVHVAHGHELDAANRFATTHAPFGRDRDGRCRLQTNWGEVFVDRFYTETERQIPFIDNLYPENAAILWTLRDNSDAARDLGAAIRALDFLRVAQTRKLNKDALGHLLQSWTGVPGKGGGGPASTSEVLAHVTDRLTNGDGGADALVTALMRLALDPELASLKAGLVAAAGALPDPAATLRALATIDPAALAKLKATLFGDSNETAAKQLMRVRGVTHVVLGHTHAAGGFVRRVDDHGYYANTGAWIAVASVAELKARGIGWDTLALADRATFPSKMTAVVIAYEHGKPAAPVVHNGR
jgi:UDP-2,3-diacylglucosamine pyrophosphatase LpxH